jgi:hypothetical protein
LEQPQTSKEFNDALLESIDEAMTALLGKGVLDSLYLHLDRFCAITKDELPNRLEAFFSILEKTLGSSGKTIGKAIAKRFYSKLQLEFDEKANHSLLEYVEEAKRKLQTLPPHN